MHVILTMESHLQHFLGRLPVLDVSQMLSQIMSQVLSEMQNQMLSQALIQVLSERLGTGSDAESDPGRRGEGGGGGGEGGGGGCEPGSCLAHRVADLWLQSCVGTRG